MKHANPLEKRLEEAAQEVRQAARHSVPPPIGDRARSPIRPGWLVFAAAFVAVTLAVGVIPALTRSRTPGTTIVGTSPTTIPAVTSTVPPDPTTSEVARERCSAAGMSAPGDQEGLPEVVAEMREAIVAAAVVCDFATLRELAGPDLVTSFGGGDFSHLVELEESAEEAPLQLLVQLFGLPYASEDYEDLPTHYYWPSAFVYDTWEEIPPADLEALRTIYTDEELDEIAAFGSYAGWRIGITEDGQWRFFVAGD